MIGKPISKYQFAQFSEKYDSKFSAFVVDTIAKLMRTKGVTYERNGNLRKITINQEQENAKIFEFSYDENGKILKCNNYNNQSLVGYDVMHFMSCLISQEFTLTIKKDQKYIYSYESSLYEKSPKDPVTGYNTYLGFDFIDFHAKTKTFGYILKDIQAQMMQNFNDNNMEILVIDLRGGNIYTNGKELVARYERDNVLPIRDDNNNFIGIFGYAHTYFQQLNEQKTPYQGGAFVNTADPQIFHKNFKLLLPQKTKIENNLIEKNKSQQQQIENDSSFYQQIKQIKQLLNKVSQKNNEQLDIKSIFSKTSNTQSSDNQLSLEEVAQLLKNKNSIKDELISEAIKINQRKYNKEIELYGVSYVSDRCINSCSYCGHNVNMKQQRSTLNSFQLCFDFQEILKHGNSDLCILAGEHPTITPQYLAKAAQIALALDRQMKNKLKRITFNVAPMSVEDFSFIRQQISGNFPLQYRIFQESYDEEVYKHYHTSGPKTNFKNRLYAQERALAGGFNFVGIGALLGLNYNNEPYQHFGHDTEILSLVAHAQRIKQISGKLPYSLSIPRYQAVEGNTLKVNSVDDELYKVYHAILKIAIPDSKIIITTRENQDLRNYLRQFTSIEDQAVKPGVGGNYKSEGVHFQNQLGDLRSTPEIMQDLKCQGYKII